MGEKENPTGEGLAGMWHVGGDILSKIAGISAGESEMKSYQKVYLLIAQQF